MEDDWEKLTVKPETNTPKTLAATTDANKKDGEDVDQIKNNWAEEQHQEDEDDDDNKKASEASGIVLQKKLSEKETQEQDELDAKAREREANMTPEERLAEDLRLQKIQEESDAGEKSGIDSMQATNKAELSELSDAISKKVTQYKHLDDFPTFLEDLMRSVCSTLGSSDLQKIKKTLDNLYTEKQKLDKEKNKKGGKGKTKASIRIESDNANIKEYGTYESYDYDDFI